MATGLPAAVRAFAPAKINLYLKVTAKRPDGYHELDSVMAPVAIYDTITLERTGSRDGISVFSSGSPHVGSGESNICHRAAKFFFERSGKAGGVSITVEKNIPVGAGMGGGSSDAATVIMALETLFGTRLTEKDRRDAAFAVGADVPFFFARGPARIGGIGDNVVPVAIEEPLWLVVVHPGIFLSTAAVFSGLNMGLTIKSRVNTIAHFNFQGISEGLANDLEQPALALAPEIGRALSELGAEKCAASMMTGSGSAVFGLFPGPDEAKAASLAIKTRNDRSWRVEATHTVNRASDFPEMILNWGVGKR